MKAKVQLIVDKETAEKLCEAFNRLVAFIAFNDEIWPILEDVIYYGSVAVGRSPKDVEKSANDTRKYRESMLNGKSNVTPDFIMKAAQQAVIFSQAKA